MNTEGPASIKRTTTHRQYASDHPKAYYLARPTEIEPAIIGEINKVLWTLYAKRRYELVEKPGAVARLARWLSPLMLKAGYDERLTVRVASAGWDIIQKGTGVGE